MNVVFMFEIKSFQKENLMKRFPSVTFYFYEKEQVIPVEKAHVLVTYGKDIDIPLLEKAHQLKWIMVASAGVEEMPLSEIEKRGIIVTNASGMHKTPMAESVLAYILSIKRALPILAERQKRKEWNRQHHSSELKGSTALILGPGAVGSEIGRLLQAFGVKTIGCNRSGKSVDFMDEVIRMEQFDQYVGQADIVISILPSTVETVGLLTEEHFRKMKNTAIFMNFGRGDLVEEKVLVNALKNAEIAYAVLDVFEVEPLPLESELWEFENCMISPHVSSFSGKYVERALAMFEDNLWRWLEDPTELTNRVDLQLGY